MTYLTIINTDYLVLHRLNCMSCDIDLKDSKSYLYELERFHYIPSPGKYSLKVREKNRKF